MSDGEAKADLAADGDIFTKRRESILSVTEVNLGRRYFIIGATGGVASVGVVGAAIPFLQYWQPSAKAKALERQSK